MKRCALFVIRSDPRRSHRPAEAIRIAAGVGGWQQIEIALYLRGPAVLALAEPPTGLVDEDLFARCLPLIQEFSHPVFVQSQAAELARLGQSPWRFEPLEDAQLATLAAQSSCVLNF